MTRPYALLMCRRMSFEFYPHQSIKGLSDADVTDVVSNLYALVLCVLEEKVELNPDVSIISLDPAILTTTPL